MKRFYFLIAHDSQYKSKEDMVADFHKVGAKEFDGAAWPINARTASGAECKGKALAFDYDWSNQGVYIALVEL
jgi:hypothetical protein